jgi:hypothetical protein
VRALIFVLLLATSLLAPAAWAQTAGPSVPAPTAHARIKSAAPKAKAAPRLVKHRTVRPAVRKAVAARPVTKARTPAHRVPAKHVEGIPRVVA